MARLKSLSSLHTAANDVAQSVERLKENEKNSTDEVRELREVVEGVQRGLDDAGRTVLANWEGVEKRMKDLEERLRRLSQ